MSPLENDIEILENAVRLFAQTMKRPQRWAAVMVQAKTDLDRPSAVILQILLNEHGACRVQDLAVRLGIEPPSVTRKTQELEQAGFLRRVPDPADRRAIDLRITSRGRSVAKRLYNAQRDILAKALQDWNPADRRQFVKLFERFSDDLSRTSVQQPRMSRQQSPKRNTDG
jgi:DNA-binding MarR family transcriptional regulator